MATIGNRVRLILPVNMNGTTIPENDHGTIVDADEHYVVIRLDRIYRSLKGNLVYFPTEQSGKYLREASPLMLASLLDYATEFSSLSPLLSG